jgi:hypothetical protein
MTIEKKVIQKRENYLPDNLLDRFNPRNRTGEISKQQ